MVCGSSFHIENVCGFSPLPSIWNLSTSKQEQITFLALALLRATSCTRVGKRTLLILPVNQKQDLCCSMPTSVSLGKQIVCWWWLSGTSRPRKLMFGVIHGEITSKVVCPGLSPVQEKWSKERVQKRVMKTTHRHEYLSCRERLRELELFSWEKRSSEESYQCTKAPEAQVQTGAIQALQWSPETGPEAAGTERNTEGSASQRLPREAAEPPFLENGHDPNWDDGLDWMASNLSCSVLLWNMSQVKSMDIVTESKHCMISSGLTQGTIRIQHGSLHGPTAPFPWGLFLTRLCAHSVFHRVHFF